MNSRCSRARLDLHWDELHWDERRAVGQVRDQDVDERLVLLAQAVFISLSAGISGTLSASLVLSTMVASAVSVRTCTCKAVGGCRRSSVTMRRYVPAGSSPKAEMSK